MQIILCWKWDQQYDHNGKVAALNSDGHHYNYIDRFHCNPGPALGRMILKLIHWYVIFVGLKLPFVLCTIDMGMQD